MSLPMQSIYLSIYLSIHPSIHLPYLSTVPICSTYLQYLSTVPIYLSIYLSIYLPIYLSTYLPIYLSIRLTTSSNSTICFNYPEDLFSIIGNSQSAISYSIRLGYQIGNHHNWVFTRLAIPSCVSICISIMLVQGLETVPFWEYWTSPYSSHLVDHIPNGWVM